MKILKLKMCIILEVFTKPQIHKENIAISYKILKILHSKTLKTNLKINDKPQNTLWKLQMNQIS